MRATRLLLPVGLALALAAGPAGAQERAEEAAGPTGQIAAPASAFDAGGTDFLRGAIDTSEPPLPPPLGAETAERTIGVPLFGPELDLSGTPDVTGTIVSPPLRPGDTPTSGRRLLLVEDQPDPFAPIGIRAGSFLFLPALDVGFVATDNADGGPDRDRRIGALFAPELIWSSDWARHQLGGETRANVIHYGDERIDVLDASARVAGRLDITRDTSFGVAGGYRFSTESLSSDDAPAGAVERPGVHTVDGQALLTHRFGRFGVEAEATASHTAYEDATLASGATAPQDDRDQSTGALRVRGVYQVSAAFTPFVEGALGGTRYDQETDGAGFERSSLFWALRGGLIVDLGPKLGGEIAVGYRHQDYEDGRLEDFGAVSADAAIVWSPERLTTIRLALSTGIDTTTLTSASAELTHSAAVTVERRMRSNLVASAGAAVALADFVGITRTDLTVSGFAEVGYDFNRMARLSARYDYSRTDSDVDGEDEEENQFTLRLRLKR